MIPMNRWAIRVGLLLSLLVALLAAAARVARAQDTTVRLTLGDAARLAARQSAAAEGARLRTEQAEARVRQRRADLLPTISALASQNGRTFNTATLGIDFPTPPGQPPIFDPNGQVLGPVNTVDIRGRVATNLLDVAALRRVGSARASVAASSADADNVAEQAATTASAAYLRVLNADAQVSARAADSALAADLLGIARNQLRAGVGIGLDVTRAQSQSAAIRAQLLAARNARDRARLELVRALGLRLETRVELLDSLTSLAVAEAPPAEAEAVERALRNRPDLRAADQQLRAAERQIAAVRAERLPALSAFGDDGGSGKDYANLLNTYTWGVQLSMPIFDGFRREGRIEEQRALAGEIDVRRRDLRQAAAIEVRSALLDLASARDQVEATRERLRFAEQEVAQARERFAAGVAGNADVITASFSLNAARDQLIGALTAYQNARVQLARAQGDVTGLP
jgi:outer membrane protein TolC